MLLTQWGRLWQVKFATGKTQLLAIWRPSVTVRLKFGEAVLSNSTEIVILGVIYDKCLSFHSHIQSIAKKAAAKVTSLRRITWLVGCESLELLYKAQIRSKMEFAPLSWSGASPTHLELLNKIQRRAERIINGEGQESNLPPLQHRRDVAGLTAMYKIHVLGAEHLRPLRQPPRPVRRVTRAAAADRAHRCLQEQRCNTLHH